MTKFMGVDPGYDRCGYAVIDEDLKVITYDVIQTDKHRPYWERLEAVYDSLCDVIDLYRVKVAGMEKPFVGKNVGNGVQVAGAWAMVGMALYVKQCEHLELSPSQVKAAVANGHATKAEVTAGVMLILSLPVAPKPDDITDALAIAICARDKWRLAGMTK